MTYLKSLPIIAAAVLAAGAAHTAPSDYHDAAQPARADVETATPSLQDIAAADPALSVREGQGDAPDTMVMLSDVLFEFADAELAPPALATLDGIAKKLAGVSGLQITGHTDSIGGAAENEALGLKRAETVRNWLIETGHLSPDAVVVASAGETQPIAANFAEDGSDNADGRALNRRVEFTIIEETQETAASATPHPTVF